MTRTQPISEAKAPGPPLSSRARGLTAYAPPTHAPWIDLRLDANEAPWCGPDVGAIADLADGASLGRYPDAHALEAQLAERWGVAPTGVLATSGGDDAIDRLCRVCLEPGRELVLPTPTFEMIERSARLAGGRVMRVPWRNGPFPIESVLGAVTADTAMIAIVSPNNPTGAVASADDLRRLSRTAPRATLMVDLAYAEFAEDEASGREDLMSLTTRLANAVAIRTFSKAYGLAGLRVGYAVGPAAIIRAMRAAGGPYPTSSLGIAIAADRFRNGAQRLATAVSRIREERQELTALLTRLGGRPTPSQANFVLCEFADAAWVSSALASLGIAVRGFTGAGLERALRITCPGEPAAFARLERALRAALRPQALLFDLDGVLAEVSGSYRQAMRLTAESFGVRIGPDAIEAAKAAGDANNDWLLTRRLLQSSGVDVPLDAVVDRFERIYHGSDGRPGVKESERLIPDFALLRRLAARLRLGIVTGRPRRDAIEFLTRFGLTGLFGAVVCMEDAPAKPDAAPVRMALERLSVQSAWLIGDTPDDVRAARAAGVVPIGSMAACPGRGHNVASQALAAAGAAAVLTSLASLEDLLS